MTRGMTVTAPVADQVRRLAADGRPRSVIAMVTGVTPRSVSQILAGRLQGRPLTPREQFDEDQRTGWAPACMGPDEWADWRAANPFTGRMHEQVARPCEDCLLGFAADMRAEGRCNGTPGGAPGDDEEETMDQSIDLPVRALVAVTAPCGGCAHTAVCRIRPELEAIKAAQVALPRVDGVRVSVAATVECEHFARERGSAAATTRRSLSPEGRARITAANQARAARQRAEREAASA